MPEYTVNSGDIMIKFTGPEDRIIRVSDRVNEKVNEGVNVHVNDRQKELLSYLVQDPGYTVSQLSVSPSRWRRSSVQTNARMAIWKATAVC